MQAARWRRPGSPPARSSPPTPGRRRPPMTVVCLKVVDALVGIRVSADVEVTGLDLSQHSENAYALGGSIVGEDVGGAPREEPSRRSSSSAFMSALGKS